MNRLRLTFGDVRSKRIVTPNHFISHMLEHIAWRMGCAIDLTWDHQDWRSLGNALGTHIKTFPMVRWSSAAMGMMDDGSAEVSITLADKGRFEINAGVNIDLEWFLSLRCEQLDSGRCLVDLLAGLADGLEAEIALKICSLEDPHHTWESVFRGVGVALNKIALLPVSGKVPASTPEREVAAGDIIVAYRSAHGAEVKRQTAETMVTVRIGFEAPSPVAFQYDGPRIDHYHGAGAMEGFRKLLQQTADCTGFSLKAVFESKMLSSSHVLLEDMGMVIGRALREVLVVRMRQIGINGAGSSIQQPGDLDEQAIRVGVSVEGRKFWQFVPLNTTYDSIRRNLIIGHTVMDGLFSEDLDDFLDGLSWGLGCSIVLHIKELPAPDIAWSMIFKNLGIALKEVFQVNPYRKGVAPGVKANIE